LKVNLLRRHPYLGELRRSSEAEHAMLSNALRNIEINIINRRDMAAIIRERYISALPDPICDCATEVHESYLV
jgi:hypothetical protein